MFTGIIEETGIINGFKLTAVGAELVVNCNKILDDIKIGDSIAVNGVCQTVIKFDKKSFTTELSKETLNVTTFSNTKIGAIVNLERALKLSDRLGGHIVSGHIDGVAKLISINKNAEFYTLNFEIEERFTKYIVKKGSITINGISLTVSNIENAQFEIAIIPHTFKNTNLTTLKVGDIINIEIDVLAKYMEKLIFKEQNISKIDDRFLKENGFY